MPPASTIAGETLRALCGDDAANLVATATDVTIVMDREGLIENLAVSGNDLVLEGSIGWVGRQWHDTVTVESRPKIAELLREAGGNGVPRWRHINHAAGNGPDVPITYAAVGIDGGRRVVALGRDMRPLAALQRRLVDAQHAMERDYLRLRQAETRYRILFEDATEAVLIVDAATRTVLEANPAAGRLLGTEAERLIGRAFPSDFDEDSTRALRDLLGAVENGARNRETSVRLGARDDAVVVSASLLRQDQRAHFVVRLRPPTAATGAQPNEHLLNALDRLPDGLVITNQNGMILASNRAFLQMVQVANELLVRGEYLEHWIGVAGVDLPVLLANLRERGTVRLFRSTLRDAHGTSSEVEISAVAVPERTRTSYGFAIREVAQRLDDAPARERGFGLLPRTVDQLGELVGRVPLRELVREATDLVERLCIEAALELTGDNRASAADMLGLSRQSLYMKLKRHGLGNLDSQSSN